MVAAGMNVARLNGAFADRDEMLKVEKLARTHVDSQIGLMIDIKGPEVRLNKFPEPISLEVGTEIEFGSSEDSKIYPANYPETYKKLTVGQEILVGDGDVKFEVIEILEAGFKARVVYGEKLKPGKALNFPGLQLQDSPLTERDLDQLEYAIERGWEFVSASFIRKPEDALAVREAIGDGKIQLIAKIEDEEGLNNIESILPTVDVVMIARGGLGVDMGLAHIAVAEHKLLEACTKAGVPVITATQMLDSMERNPFPTRAEANDVGTAIIKGSDAVMLSGETTAGEFPLEAVQFMSEVDKHCREVIKPRGEEIINTRSIKLIEEIIKALNKNEVANIVIVHNHTLINSLAKIDLNQLIYPIAKSDIEVRQFSTTKNTGLGATSIEQLKDLGVTGKTLVVSENENIEIVDL